jgi:hypothetical protein
MVGMCSVSTLNCSATRIHPDPEIAGIGVTISFVFTCGIAIVFSLIDFLFMDEKTLHAHPVDRWIHTQWKRLNFKPLRKMKAKRSEYWHVVLEGVILGLSDLQLLTGIAILAAAYMSCEMSVYHSNIVADLAFFSSGTQLSTLGALKTFLMKYPAVRNVKVIFVLTMGAMLLSVVILQGHKDWYAVESAPKPAYCLFVESIHNIGGEAESLMISNIVLIVLSHFAIIVLLYPRMRRIVLISKTQARAIFNSVLKFLYVLPYLLTQNLPKGVAAIVTVVVVAAEVILVLAGILLLCAWGSVWLYCWWMDSYAGTIMLEIAWFSYGLWNLLQERAAGRDSKYMSEEDSHKENEWGFGQTVPMLLAFLPILTAWQSWYRTYTPVHLAGDIKLTSHSEAYHDKKGAIHSQQI